jgi:hypothetical protein
LALTEIADVARRAEELFHFSRAAPIRAATEARSAVALLEEALVLCRQMVDALPDRVTAAIGAGDFVERADSLLSTRTK